MCETDGHQHADLDTRITATHVDNFAIIPPADHIEIPETVTPGPSAIATVEAPHMTVHGAPSRRTVNKALLGFAAAAFFDPGVAQALARAPLERRGAMAQELAAMASQVVSPVDGTSPFANAMHIHTSSSEQPGSLESQLAEALSNGVGVLWKTDHDWRELGHGAIIDEGDLSAQVQTVHDKTIVWQSEQVNPSSLGSSTFEFVAGPPITDGSTPVVLHVGVQSKDTTPVSQRAYMDDLARESHKVNVAGQAMTLDIFPASVDGANGYAEVVIDLSYHPAQFGPNVKRPGHSIKTTNAGQYRLSYRFGIGAVDPSAQYETQQNLGIVRSQLTPGAWNQVVLNPLAAIQKLWNLAAPADNSTQDLHIGVTSQTNQGQPAEAFFKNLTFSRTAIDPQSILSNEQAIKDQLQPLYPGILLPRGREYSYFGKHILGYGPGATYFPNLSNLHNESAGDGYGATDDYITVIQQAGGLAAIGHILGAAEGKLTSSSAYAQVARLAVAKILQYYPTADILETGYNLRGGDFSINGQRVVADLKTHQNIWDMVSRNGLLMTANGVSDNHSGTVGSWLKNVNCGITTTWAEAKSEAAIMDALRAGRAFVSFLGKFGGTLDALVLGDNNDVAVPMGMADRITANSRVYRIFGSGIPTDGAIRVIQGPIDHAGVTDPGTSTVATIPEAAITSNGGSYDVGIDTTGSTFTRVDVLDAGGSTVAFGQPAYLVKTSDTRTQIPAWRQAS